MTYEQYELDLFEGAVEDLLEEEAYDEFLNTELEGYVETRGYLSEWELLDNP